MEEAKAEAGDQHASGQRHHWQLPELNPKIIIS
jgi:hypothetical protein